MDLYNVLLFALFNTLNICLLGVLVFKIINWF